MTEPDEFPPITLKTDGQVGVYFLCDEAGADDLRDCLKADEVKFSFNPAEGAHLLEGDKVLFAFGRAHPRFVAEALEFIGEEVLLDPAVVMPEDALFAAGETYSWSWPNRLTRKSGTTSHWGFRKPMCRR
ncbi:MAG: hypothetical protein V9H26_07890 [Verrucomicrobiota bacterium]